MKHRPLHRPSARSRARWALLPCILAALGATALAATSPPYEKEHGPVTPHGITINWVGAPTETFFAELGVPVVSLRLVNLDRVAYVVRARSREDAGSLQTRRVNAPVSITLPAGGRKDLAVHFAAGTSALFTHSGMVMVEIEACPAPGGACIGGASYPLFFHPVGRRFLVYGEKVLCQRFRCGALAGQTAPERGTWRVMGGGPLHATAVSEEPPSDEDRAERVVDGGAQ